MPDSSKKQKEQLNETLDSYILHFRRKTGKEPGILPISEAEGLYIRGLIVKHMEKNENSEKYFYICSNDVSEDTILVWQGVEVVAFEHQEDVDRMREAVR